MLATGIALSLALVSAQGQRVPSRPTFELPESRHGEAGTESIDEAQVLRIEADGSIRAGEKLLVPACSAGQEEYERQGMRALRWRLEELARTLPPDPRARVPEGQDPIGVLREGSLRVRAHRDAPMGRVLDVMEACTARRVRIPAVEFAVQRDGAPESLS